MPVIDDLNAFLHRPAQQVAGDRPELVHPSADGVGVVIGGADHVIVCGLGRVGEPLDRRLADGVAHTCGDKGLLTAHQRGQLPEDRRLDRL